MLVRPRLSAFYPRFAMKISVVGLGKLGLPLAETLALRHAVSGFDLAARTSETVRDRLLPRRRLRGRGARARCPADAARSRVRRHGADHAPSPRDFEYEPLAEVLEAADAAAADGAPLAVVSTVLPGTTRRELAPHVTRRELLYTPAFMAMGRVRQDFLEPEFRLLGTETGDHGGGQAMQELWRSFDGAEPIHLVTWEEAEAVKIFYNVFISFKIAFANTVQDVAERIGHVDADVVVAALSGRDRPTPLDAVPEAGDGRRRAVPSA